MSGDIVTVYTKNPSLFTRKLTSRCFWIQTRQAVRFDSLGLASWGRVFLSKFSNSCSWGVPCSVSPQYSLYFRLFGVALPDQCLFVVLREIYFFMVQGLSLELIMSGVPNDCKTMDWQSVPYTFLLFFFFITSTNHIFF